MEKIYTRFISKATSDLGMTQMFTNEFLGLKPSVSILLSQLTVTLLDFFPPKLSTSVELLSHGLSHPLADRPSLLGPHRCTGAQPPEHLLGTDLES